MATRMELEMQIVLYAHQRVITGHLRECLDLGFDMDALRIIRNLDPAAFTRYDARRKTPIMTAISIDHQALARLANELNQAALVESVIDQLLRRGASTTMLKHYFGINRQEVYDRKKLLALPASARGRRTRHITTRSEESLILHRLREVLRDIDEQDRSTALVQCQALLTVAADTNNCVNDVWEVADKHHRRGTFAWHHLDRAVSI